MAAQLSDATNVVVSAPKRSQELSDITNRVLLAHSAHRHYEYDSLSAESSQALRICAPDVLHHHAFWLVRPAALLRTLTDPDWTISKLFQMSVWHKHECGNQI